MIDHTSQGNLSRKEREKRARQQDILKVARRLFVTKGYRETTLEEIAHQAEFGKGTLYNYFASKEEILHVIIDQTMEEILSLARESVTWPGGIREKLAHYALGTIRYVKENGELIHIITQEMHRWGPHENASKVCDLGKRARSMWGSIAQILQEGMHEGTIRKGDPKRYVMLFDGMVRGYIFTMFILEDAPSDDESARAAELIVSVFLDGITERKTKG